MPATVQLREESARELTDYATVSIAFEVRCILAVADGEPGQALLTPELVAVPYVKDYDREPGNHPTEWRNRFDVTRWGAFAAWAGETRVGGAVVAWQSPEVDLLEGRDDLAVLWDVRVSGGRRGAGIGTALFRAAERWALARGARFLKAETQNTNLPACRFYASQGCELGAVHRFAYPSLPDEIQLFWYKSLAPAALS